MKTVSEKTSRKMGLFSAICMLIGAVIGVGIFLKNNGIFKNNDYNAMGILVSWIIGGIIAFCAAYSFAEIGSCVRSRSGLAGWAGKLINQKVGNFVKITQPIFYIAILHTCISVFTAEAIIFIFPENMIKDLHFGYIILFGFSLSIWFITCSFISIKATSILSNITTFLTVIPLIGIFILGIVFASINNTTGLFQGYVEIENIKKPVGSFNFNSILISLPSVLFAFDSFSNVGNIALDIKNPKKNVPLTIIIGMLFCAIMYVLITISQILMSEGNGLIIFRKFQIDPTFKLVLESFLKIFVTMSIIGVLNFFSLAGIRSFNSLIEEKGLLFNESFIKNTVNKIMPNSKSELKYGYVLFIFFSCLYFIFLTIPSIAINPKIGTDAFFDGISNFPTLFFFFIYGMVILAGIYNRYTKKHEVIKQRGFIFTGIISIIGIIIIFSYLFFYEYLINVIITLAKDQNTLKDSEKYLNWGLFFPGTTKVHKWEGMICFFAMFIYFFSLPISNYLLKKKIKKVTKVESVNEKITSN